MLYTSVCRPAKTVSTLEYFFGRRRNKMVYRRATFWKIATLLLIVGLIIPARGAANAQDKVEITFWKHSHPPADALTKTIIEEYQAKNPNVTIKMEIIPSDAWQNKILTAAAGGQLPDLFDTNDANHAIFVSRGLLAPVDPAAFGFKD